MAGKPFDAAMKEQVDENAQAYAQRFTKGKLSEVEVIDADVSTVTAAADKVIRTRSEAGVSLLNVEALSSYDKDAPDTLHLYSTLLRHRHRLAVRSVLLLLRQQANSPTFTGNLQVIDPEEQALANQQGRAAVPYEVFRYEVVRLWSEPKAPYLNGPLGLAALAGLTDEAAVDLPGTVKHLVSRFRNEAPPALAAKMEAALFVLLGMRYEVQNIAALFEENKLMEESSTYQYILSKGRLKGRVETIVYLGKEKFKQDPDEATKQALESITDLKRLDQLSTRLLQVDSWPDLLRQP